MRGVQVEFDIDSTIAYTVLPTPVILYYLETAAVAKVTNAQSPSNMISVTVTTSTEEPLLQNTSSGVDLPAIASDTVVVTVPTDMCATPRKPSAVVNPVCLRVTGVSASSTAATTPVARTALSGLHLQPLPRKNLSTPTQSPMPITSIESPAVAGGVRLNLGPRNVLLVEDNLVQWCFRLVLTLQCIIKCIAHSY